MLILFSVWRCAYLICQRSGLTNNVKICDRFLCFCSVFPLFVCLFSCCRASALQNSLGIFLKQTMSQQTRSIFLLSFFASQTFQWSTWCITDTRIRSVTYWQVRNTEEFYSLVALWENSERYAHKSKSQVASLHSSIESTVDSKYKYMKMTRICTKRIFLTCVCYCHMCITDRILGLFTDIYLKKKHTTMSFRKGLTSLEWCAEVRMLLGC